jgi:hypothetical protein
MSQKRRGMLAAAVLFAAACPIALWAQETAPKPAGEAQPAPARDTPRPPAQAANIQMAIVLTDQIDGKTVVEEPVNFLLADRQLGRLRRRLPSNVDKNFEVDVTPEIVGSRVKIAMTVSYNAQSATDARDQTHTTLFVETLTAFLDPGKPTTIVETNGDIATRRVTLKATATILK